ncbi:RNA-directed RNA polymerase [ssRNA phage AVE015]|uniref:RNA-directed RNA polymerase n=1 Tax=ssRNA phage AVE015 TaxID=2785987 RepID=A0A8S5KXS2_9VIRU|nr:RNA-directed RNA polymerase [ssRNA phage AVE015]DAD49853.1 TPA_asm: RNA-directed RNA polymerase [ssRNA phage AVE015]
MKNGFYQDLENLEQSVRGTRSSGAGKPPAVFIDAYILWVILIWDLIDDQPRSRITSYALRFLSRNAWHSILDTLDESADLLFSEIACNSYTDFKHLWKTKLVDFELLTLFKRNLMSCEESMIGRVYEAFCFMRKLTIDDSDLEAAAIESFFSLEEKLDVFSPNGEIIAPILERWLRTFTIEGFIPRHGNGVCADTTNYIVEKYASFGPSDAKLDYFLDHYNLRDVFPRRMSPRKGDRSLVRNAKLICVPKTFKKKRTILAEPAILQYLQQGVLQQLDEFIMNSRGRFGLSRRIDLHDAEKNRDLAEEGSLSGTFDTIDLSAASDGVSRKLVRQAFGRTSLYAPLVLLRSSNVVSPDGVIHELKKFAGMGSAVTFPVECLIFAAACEAAIIQSGGDPVTSGYRVYGDDIVIEREYTETVIKILNQLGFTVNTGKSFTGRSSRGFFRESCGGFFLNMVDITPVKLSRSFRGFSGRPSPQVFSGLVEFSNSCVARHPLLRLAIIRFVKRLFGANILYDSTGLRGFWSNSSTNFHLKGESFEPKNPTDSRWYAGIQTSVAKVKMLTTKRELPKMFLGLSGPYLQARLEDIRYFEWQRTCQKRRMTLQSILFDYSQGIERPKVAVSRATQMSLVSEYTLLETRTPKIDTVR